MYIKSCIINILQRNIENCIIFCRSQHIHIDDKKRTVNFPENLLSLPQRLENMIAEQQRRLDRAVIDTAGRRSPPRVTQSLPQLNETTQTAIPIFNKE